ncbi:putative enoyl-CoA hydratase 2 [Mycena venus]|uniref:Putative enoyl-CoA hydratase 2 n=1 Tax=Mycena venus TaxID=2733690 RepID=A0A8H6XMS8_9AGAR|nr:putative enoyl-CoA hydratase 2 [Mycena venus]
MAAELSKLVGHEQPTIPVSWNKRDVLLYAAGIGAKADDLNIVYVSKAPAGIPKCKVAMHGSQSIEILKDLPVASGPGWTWTTKYTGIVENKKGIILISESILLDPRKVPYARLYSSSFHIGAKATGERFSKVIAGPPQGKLIPKDHKADWSVQDKTSPEQALVFRLSGDYNPFHIDPEIGKKGGFGGVVLHSLSTFGFGARALIKAIGAGDPRSLKFFGARFTSPVRPGDALQTEVWEIGPGPNGTIEVAFVTKDLTSGKVALGGGIAYIKKASPEAKL